MATIAALICASFIILPISAGASMHQPPILISTNERSYVTGELVSINGQIQPPVTAGQLLVIRIFAPDGEFYRQSELEVARDGLFSWSFLPTGETGEWTITAQFSDKETETVFTILDNDFFDRVIITNLVLTDMQGHEITSSKAGDNAIITANLANDEPDVQQSYVFIVQIADSEGRVELVSLTLGSLAPGQSANPSVGWLPETPGIYTAEVFVWSSLSNPAPLAEKQTMTFAIE